MVGLRRDCGAGRDLAAKEVAAAWVRRAGQRDTRADVVAAWRDGGHCGRKSLSSQSSIGNSLRAVANVGFIWIICNMTSRQLWAP